MSVMEMEVRQRPGARRGDVASRIVSLVAAVVVVLWSMRWLPTVII